MSLKSIRQDIVNIPNLLTLFRVALIPPVCIFIFLGDPVSVMIAVILFWVASVTDWVDGYIARRQNLVSMTGKFLDPLADKLLIMASLVMMLPMGRIPSWLVIVIIGRELTVSGLRSIAATEGLVISAGEGGKYKTTFQMIGILLLLIHFTYEVPYYGIFTLRLNFHILGLGLILISAVFSITSAVEYFRGFLSAIGQAADEEEA